MTIQYWLQLATQALHDSNIQTTRLDALILLEDATARDRAWLLAHDDTKLTAEQLDQLADWLERRMQHEPLAYIRGFQEFYGRRFIVTPDVLVPRPESETIIDLLKKYHQPDQQITDVGTGSGALAVTATLETGAAVTGTDIDEQCLVVARANAIQHGADTTFLQGNLLVGTNAAIVLANLPYVPTDYPINDAARHEPELALFSGPDGLDLYRDLFAQTTAELLITESLPQQHTALAAIAREHSYDLRETADFIQVYSATNTLG